MPCRRDGGRSGSGYSQSMATDASTLDFESLAREAVEMAQRSRNPIDMNLGEYPVVLNSYATADMLQNLIFMGLSATAVQEERSFMNGQFGKQLVSEKIIYDDAHDPPVFRKHLIMKGSQATCSDVRSWCCQGGAI